MNEMAKVIYRRAELTKLKESCERIIYSFKSFSNSNPSREISLYITKLEEAEMWLAKELGKVENLIPEPENE
jgi:hypothetical protein